MFDYTGGYAKARAPDPAVRRLSIELTRDLPAGADHYRAFDGAPKRSTSCRPSDLRSCSAWGCANIIKCSTSAAAHWRSVGSLYRFYRKAGTLRLSPHTWLVEDGLEHELGADIIAVKRPSFASNDDFDCTVFSERFDFIVAQSIITHCGVDIVDKLARQFAEELFPPKAATLCSRSLKRPRCSPVPPPMARPTPSSSPYGTLGASREIFRQAGLACRKLPWYHPGATWFIAARDATALPRNQDLWLLRGAVLSDQQFAELDELGRHRSVADRKLQRHGREWPFYRCEILRMTLKELLAFQVGKTLCPRWRYKSHDLG